MPIGLGGAAAITGAATLIGQGANAYSTGRMNKKQRKFAEAMYDKSRYDALSDWQRQNEYNSPTAEMQRLREAGLNPNLIYDNGAGAGASGPIRSTSTPEWHPHAPQIDTSRIGEAVSQYADVRNKGVQYDNMRAQTEILKQEALLKAAQTYETWTRVHSGDQRTDKMTMENEVLRNTMDNTIAASQQSLKKLFADTTRVELENEKLKALTPKQVELMNQQIDNLRKDGKLKDYEILLNQRGLSKSDPVYLRTLYKMAVDNGLIKDP